MSPEIVVAEQDELARVLIGRLSVAAREASPSGRRLSVALPGGSAAESLLPTLAAAPIDWTHWDFFWSDERGVAPEHPDSNYGLGLRLLLGPIGADPRRVHRMRAEGPDLEAAARGGEAELVDVVGDPPALDFVLMGVGPDGHVCSLFPGHAALLEEKRWVVPIPDSPKPPPGRITLTLRALEVAQVVCVAAFGESKAEVLGAALGDPASALPVARVARRAGATLFLLDPPAAARVSGG
ncbi:MAG TPA: 6-phosphogluconolactonase [Vicinamibacteria bacterium]